MNILSTIVPIFIIIFLGLYAKHRGFFSPEFLNQANRLVYYIAIPAMIFNSVSKSNLKTQMNIPVILIALATLVSVFWIAWGITRILSMGKPTRGSFVQSAFHGNLGYIGLAVVFYYLGSSGFVRAAIIAGFVMIVQNILAVAVLQYCSEKNAGGSGLAGTLKKTMANPVILSAMAGIGFSVLGLPLPVIIDRSLDILEGMALPVALLIIGASLSFEKFRPRFLNVIIVSILKLILMPAIGLAGFRYFGIDLDNYLPALIILASPTATLTYIMAKEIGGDADFAVAAISVSTIFSSVTYGIWLGIG